MNLNPQHVWVGFARYRIDRRDLHRVLLTERISFMSVGTVALDGPNAAHHESGAFRPPRETEVLFCGMDIFRAHVGAALVTQGKLVRGTCNRPVLRVDLRPSELDVTIGSKSGHLRDHTNLRSAANFAGLVGIALP